MSLCVVRCFVVRRSSFVVPCWSLIACCLWFVMCLCFVVVRCGLLCFVVCCLSFRVVRCALCVERCLLSVVSC